MSRNSGTLATLTWTVPLENVVVALRGLSVDQGQSTAKKLQRPQQPLPEKPHESTIASAKVLFVTEEKDFPKII